jgi:hypothetical protein
MVDIIKDVLLKYKLLILIVLILSFIASCHCIKPRFLKNIDLSSRIKENSRVEK